ncbi:MAG: hypothetical protein ACRDF8_00745 [Chloroflexota bacterium]
MDAQDWLLLGTLLFAVFSTTTAALIRIYIRMGSFMTRREHMEACELVQNNNSKKLDDLAAQLNRIAGRIEAEDDDTRRFRLDMSVHQANTIGSLKAVESRMARVEGYLDTRFKLSSEGRDKF